MRNIYGKWYRKSWKEFDHYQLTDKKSCKKKDRSSEWKATEYYLKTKKQWKEELRNWYKNLSKEENDKIKEYQRKRYQQFIQFKNYSITVSIENY